MSKTPQHLTPSLADLQQSAERQFIEQFDYPSNTVVAAPGRVNLIGEHIDYNDGFVLPMAIERYALMAAKVSESSDENVIRVHSKDLNQTETISLDQPILPGQPNRSGWISYVEGVVAGFIELGVSVPAFDVVVASTIPLGGGLSSSAALEVATATLIEQLTGHTLGLQEKALLCQKAEHEFAGVPCGIMDQFSSVFGKTNELLLIDCQSQKFQYVPMTDDDISVLITNSNVKHELAGGQYAARRTQCNSALKKLASESWRGITLQQIEDERDELSDVEFKRARHIVTEIKRTTTAAKAIGDGDWILAGELISASHNSLRDDFEVSCRELDLIVEISNGIGRQNGMIGSRMTGGGFGGSTVSLVENSKLASIIETLTEQYKSATGITAECFSSRPGRGAHVVKAS